MVAKRRLHDGPTGFILSNLDGAASRASARPDLACRNLRTIFRPAHDD